MNKLTLKIEYSDFLNDDITNYLTSLNGVKLVTIKNDENEIYVEYDSSIISLKLLKMEILLYLDIAKVPSIVAFDKHLKKNHHNKTIGLLIVKKKDKYILEYTTNKDIFITTYKLKKELN